MSEEAIFRALNDVQARYSNIADSMKKMEELLKKNDEKLDRAHENKDNQNKILEELGNSLGKAMILSQSSHTYLSNEIDKLKKALSIAQDVQNNIIVSYAHFSKALDDEKQNLDSFKEHIVNSLEVKIFTLRAEVEEIITNLPKPQIPSSEDISTVIRLQLEPISIDAKNGCLRSANNDMRLSIVEKKIDQIFLLLQRHSLNQ